VINKTEEEYVERLAKYEFGDGTKAFVVPMLRHFLDGTHTFVGIDTQLPRWFETANPEKYELEFASCECCGLKPDSVSKLPDTFWNFEFLTSEESDYLNRAKDLGDFWTAFAHLVSCKHEWYECESPTLPKCKECGLSNWDVSHAGEMDAMFLCHAISISARPFMIDEYEDGSLLLEWR